MTLPSDLQRSPLFAQVPQAAIRDAAQVVIECHYEAGDDILRQDAEADALHLLVSGVVRVSRMSLGGRERIMGDIYAPGILGEGALLADVGRTATIHALTTVKTYMLHREHFETLLRKYPRVLWNVARILAQRVTSLNDELIAFGLHTEAALSHVFLQLCQQRTQVGLPHPEILPLTQHDLTLRSGCSRETIVRVLKKMEQQGVVKVEPTTIRLLDFAALEALRTDLNTEE